MSSQQQQLSPEEQAQVDEFELEAKKHARKITFKEGDIRTLRIKRFVGKQPNEIYVGKIDWVFEAADVSLLHYFLWLQIQDIALLKLSL